VGSVRIAENDRSAGVDRAARKVLIAGNQSVHGVAGSSCLPSLYFSSVEKVRVAGNVPVVGVDRAMGSFRIAEYDRSVGVGNQSVHAAAGSSCLPSLYSSSAGNARIMVVDRAAGSVCIAEIDRAAGSDRIAGNDCIMGIDRAGGKPMMYSVDLTGSPSSSLGFCSKASWRITEWTSSLFSGLPRARRLVLVASPNRERERNMGSNKIKTNRAMAEMMNDMMSTMSRKYIETTAAAGKKS